MTKVKGTPKDGISFLEQYWTATRKFSEGKLHRYPCPFYEEKDTDKMHMLTVYAKIFLCDHIDVISKFISEGNEFGGISYDPCDRTGAAIYNGKINSYQMQAAGTRSPSAWREVRWRDSIVQMIDKMSGESACQFTDEIKKFMGAGIPSAWHK